MDFVRVYTTRYVQQIRDVLRARSGGARAGLQRRVTVDLRPREEVGQTSLAHNRSALSSKGEHG